MPERITPFVAGIFFLVTSLGISGEKASALASAKDRLRKAAAAQGVAWPLKSPSILIQKSKRRLTLKAEGQTLRTFPVGLGSSPHLNKLREGDHRTPEGRFYVCSRNAASQFHLFLGISYPGTAEAERGLREHLITQSQAETICRAEVSRRTPPQFTPLGGLVGIHGGGSTRDWTWGCIALENAAIEELWVACALGTPVEIEP